MQHGAYVVGIEADLPEMEIAGHRDFLFGSLGLISTFGSQKAWFIFFYFVFTEKNMFFFLNTKKICTFAEHIHL